MIQTPQSVLLAKDIYLEESKKDISFFLARCKGFTSLTIKLFWNFILGKILSILIFFFEKKKI